MGQLVDHKIFVQGEIKAVEKNESTQPLVSIGLPVYNGEDFLEEVLESILGQTFTDFELLISDNASTDRTEQICEKFAKKDKRIRYFRSKQNLGATANFNRVFYESNGKYFKWATHDDLISPYFLEKCVKVLEENPDVVLCHTKVDIIKEDGQLDEHYGIELKTDDYRASRRFRELLIKWQRCFPLLGLIRTDALQQTPVMGNYGHADGVLLARLGLLGRFYEVPEILFFYRTHKKQSTSVYGNKSKQGGNDYYRFMAWFDPSKKSRLVFPHWKIVWEYFKSIWMVPLSFSERMHCLVTIIWFIRIRARNLLLDIKIAIITILNNFLHWRRSQASVSSYKNQSGVS